MYRVGEDDRIRVAIPDESNPGHALHGSHGTVITVIEDDAGLETGRPQDSIFCPVARSRAC